jgi:hypothetical protein
MNRFCNELAYPYTVSCSWFNGALVYVCPGAGYPFYIMKDTRPAAQVKQELGKYLNKIIYMPIVNLDQPDAPCRRLMIF